MWGENIYGKFGGGEEKILPRFNLLLIISGCYCFFFLKKKKGFKEENCSLPVTSAATVMPGDT